jgi:hypothetical protein
LIYDPLCAERSRPTCATGGGGDTEEEVNLATGHVFFSDQEVVANEAYGFSSDHGDHFMIQDPGTGQATAVDRQWIAATDDTFSPVPGTTIEGFFSYHVPLAGEYIQAIDQSGIVLPQPAPQIPLVVQSGQSRVDNNAASPGHGFIYLPYACLDGTCMGAAASADYATAAGWTSAVVTSDTVTSFPWAAVDAAGNAYLSWDTGGLVYFSASPIHDKANDPSQGGRPGTFWTPKVQVSLPAVGSAVFPEIIGGANGTIGLTYTGTTSFSGAPDDAPDATLWQTYAAVITNALSASPTVFSGLVSHRPVHQGNVCTSGTSCLTTGKDRSLLDMIDVAFDQQGRLGVVFEDNHSSFAQADLATADQSPFVHWARQTSGPSVLGGSIKAPGKPGTSATDPKGDATWPNASTGANLPSLDETEASIARKGSNIVATVSLADGTVAGMTRDLAAYNAVLQDTPPAQRLQYVVRISTTSEHYFVAMVFDPSLPGSCRCAFSGGRLDQNDWVTNPTSGAVVGAGYAPDPGITVTGSISRGTITFTVPGAQIGLGSKTAEFSVTAFATVGPRQADLSMLNPMRTLDATKPLDTNV